MNYICGIDPACKYTAFSICEWESMKPYKFGRMENQEALTAMLDTIHSLIEDGHTVEVAIEGFQSYGNELYVLLDRIPAKGIRGRKNPVQPVIADRGKIIHMPQRQSRRQGNHCRIM